MKLDAQLIPGGKTCASCHWFAGSCRRLMSLSGDERRCHFEDSMFCELPLAPLPEDFLEMQRRVVRPFAWPAGKASHA